MTDLDQYLEGLLNQVCTDLAQMYPSEQQPSEYGLVFPSKRDGTLRISEQEAKLLVVQHLTVDRRYCFSVETPTGETYQQKGKTPISARVDLTMFGSDRKPVAHVELELKAHNCTVEAIRKDLEKLLRERTTGMWFHTLHRADGRTLDTLIGKFKSAFSLLPECLRTNGRSYLIAFFVLEDARLHWQWLHLSGDDSRNRDAVAAMFGEECPSLTLDDREVPRQQCRTSFERAGENGTKHRAGKRIQRSSFSSRPWRHIPSFTFRCGVEATGCASTTFEDRASVPACSPCHPAHHSRT
ncbi:MAG: hypothetical protein HYS04_08060 [Acidobacteria bacterium]|nr:hypothetical protein [Acidobacteriota bacterium]